MKFRNIYIPVLALTLTAALTACSDDDKQLTELDAITASNPNATFESLTFGWDKVSGAVQYGYQLNKGDRIVNTGTTTSTSASFTGLEPDTEYTLTVWSFAAMNSDFTTSPAVTITARTNALTVLAVPKPSVTVDGGTLSAEWSADPVVETYKWEIIKDGVAVRSDEQSETTLSVRGLEAGTYALRVKAETTAAGYVNSDWSAPVSFIISRMRLWQVEGNYHSAALDSDWNAKMTAYDDGSYTIEAFYGVAGYDLSFSINPGGEYGSFEMLCGDFDADTWLYSVPTGDSRMPELYVYPYYEYSYFSGNATAGSVVICNYTDGDYLYDEFTYDMGGITMEQILGDYNNHYSGNEWESDDYVYYDDVIDLTISLVEGNTVSINSLWYEDCPLIATVDLEKRTITIDPQDYADYYVFADVSSQDKAVVGTINDDMSITFSDFSYWYDWSGTWYSYLYKATCHLVKK